MLFRPFGPGRLRFSGVGRGSGVAAVHGFLCQFFVCCNYRHATAPAATRRDQPLLFKNRRGRQSAARAGIIALCTDFSGTDNCPDYFSGDE